MALLQDLQNLGARGAQLKEALARSEEATKHGMILPFLQALGYDIHDPTEVVPEHTPVVGEKIDYVVMIGGKPTIVIEVKVTGKSLDARDQDQLNKYFSMCKVARVGVLTNGFQFIFFTDSEQTSHMDASPFLKIDLLNLDESVVPILEALSKTVFKPNQEIKADWKYVNDIKEFLSRETMEPSDEFAHFIADHLLPDNRRVNQRVRSEFKTFTKEAFRQFLEERIAASRR